MVEILQHVFPPGLVQLLGGEDSLGPQLTNHPDVKVVSFTGSIPTGRKIAEACAKGMKKAILELGGNDAAIVCEDVDVEATAAEVARGGFFNTSQLCANSKRILVHEQIYKQFLKAMIKTTKTFGLDAEGGFMGPVANEMQYDKLLQIFEDSRRNGHEFALGDPEPKSNEGFFINPAIIDNPPSDSIIWREEPFGPIVPVQPWSDEADAIRRANDDVTGLAASVYSRDIERAERIATELEVGTVFVYSHELPAVDTALAAQKLSGNAYENGLEGMLEYTYTSIIKRYKNKVNF